jgi:membrane protein required for colicin V production
MENAMGTNFNMFDVLVVLVVIMGVWMGIRKGGVREVARILGLIIAFIFGMQLMKPIGLIIVSSLNLSTQIAPVVGFVVVFLGIILAVTIVARLLEAVIGTLMLGPVDRLLGGAIGGLKAILVLSIGLMMVGGVGYPGEQTRETSAFYQPVEQVAPATWKVVSLVLPEAQQITGDVGDRLEQEIENQIKQKSPF